VYWTLFTTQGISIRRFGKWAPLQSPNNHYDIHYHRYPCGCTVFRNSTCRLKILGATSRSHRGADNICAVLGLYAASNGSSLPALRDNLSGPSPRVKGSWPLNKGRIGLPETSVRNYHSTRRKNAKQRRSHEASSTRRTTNNRSHCTKFSRHGDPVSKCTLLFTPILVTTTGVEPTHFQIRSCKAKN